MIPFAGLLKQLRTRAGITQEQLAELTGLSPRSISDLERGVHLTARRETTRLLADALGLTGTAKEAFEAAARGRTGADETPEADIEAGGVAAATRTLPRDVSSFTGRESELRQLTKAMTDHLETGWVAGIYAIGGMAGIGKTAFAVHAAHQLAPQFPDGQIFLQLHGHSPGQRPVDSADALASLLQTAGVAAEQIPKDLESRARLWRDYLVGKKLLLLLDDAAGHEQVRPLLPGTAGSLVLITSRRHLTALEDTQAISLDTLAPDAAADLLIRVAARPGLSADQSAVREITNLCGYLPLAIGILARQLHHHPSWTAAELAAELAATRGDRSAEMRAEGLSVAAAFDLSYQELTDDQQRLFRRLGLHSGPDIDDYSTAALDASDLAATHRNLADLYDHCLLTEPAHGRYRMHDLIGEHAKALARNDTETDRQAAVDRLMEYYLQTALAADRYQVRRTPTGNPSISGIRPTHLPDMTDREHAVRWMNAERFNLHAAVNYAATHEKPQYAIAIAIAMHGFLRSEGHWNQALTLYRTVLDSAGQTEDQLAQADVLADLGDMQTLSGDYHTAIASHEEALRLYRSLDHQLGEANSLNKLGTVQQAAGIHSAITNLKRALELHHSLGDQLGEANDLNQLGIVQYETGDYPAATASHERALKLRRLIGDSLGEANALYRLGSVQYSTGNYRAAALSLTQALALDRDAGYRFGEATALVRLGQLRQATGDYGAATTAQEQALALHRSIGYPRGEADALNNLGLIHQAAGDQHRAAANYNRALEIYRSIGFRLGEAEALNSLGELCLAVTSPADALSYHERALAIAKGVTSLAEEARALEGIGRCQIGSGRLTEATTLLRQSLAIYQRMGSPSAQRVETLIHELDT